MQSLSLLFETLSEDLLPDLLQLASDPHAQADCLSYLSSLLEGDLLLSALPPSTTHSSSDPTNPSLDPTGTGLGSIIEEMAELSSRQRTLELQLKQATVAKGPAIVSSLAALFAFQQGFESRFGACVAALESQCSALGAAAAVAAAPPPPDAPDVASTTLILNHLPLLTDLLELPLLVKICIKQGNYQEALEVHQFAKRLLIRFDHLPLLTSIHSQISLELNEMMLGLVNLMSTDLKHTSLVKTVGILARLTPFAAEPRTLRVAFLAARMNFIHKEFSYLQPLVRVKTTPHVEKFLKRSIEIVREYGYSTVSTYQSVFPGASDSVFIHRFLHKLFGHLLLVLQEWLPSVVGAAGDVKTATDGLLLQLCYCLLSVSRIGGQSFQYMFVKGLGEKGLVDEELWKEIEGKVKR